MALKLKASLINEMGSVGCIYLHMLAMSCTCIYMIVQPVAAQHSVSFEILSHFQVDGIEEMQTYLKYTRNHTLRMTLLSNGYSIVV